MHNWCPVVSTKTATGSWNISTIPSMYDALYFTWIPDSSYNNKTEDTNYNYYLEKDGRFFAKFSSSSLIDAVPISKGGTGAYDRANARKNLGIAVGQSAPSTGAYDPDTIYVQF